MMIQDLSDEGFKSREDSLTSSTSGEEGLDGASFDSVYQSDYDTSIYETCLTEKISQYYTWETMGLYVIIEFIIYVCF